MTSADLISRAKLTYRHLTSVDARLFYKLVGLCMAAWVVLAALVACIVWVIWTLFDLYQPYWESYVTTFIKGISA